MTQTWQQRTAEEHLTDLLAAFLSRQKKVNNVRMTAVALHLLAVIAEHFEEAEIGIAQLRNLVNARKLSGPDLDLFGEGVMPEAQRRRDETRGITQILFNRSSSSGVQAIPTGTLCSQTTAEGTFFYETTAAGQWDNGKTQSDPIAARAQAPGSSSNAIVGAIDTVVSEIAGIIDCSNTVACTGLDQEQDDDYLQRIVNYIRSLARCNPSAIVAKVQAVELDDGRRVVIARAIEDPTDKGAAWVYIDDGFGATDTSETLPSETLVSSAVGGERLLYTSVRPWRTAPVVKKNGSALTEGTDYTTVPAWGQIRLAVPLIATESITVEPYTAYTGLVRQAQRVIDGDPSDRTTYPGNRGAGVVITVLPAAVKGITIVGKLVVKSGYDKATVIAAVKTALIGYINRLGMKATVYTSQLVGIAVAVDGVEKFDLQAPAADVYQQDVEVPRTSSSSTTIS